MQPFFYIGLSVNYLLEQTMKLLRILLLLLIPAFSLSILTSTLSSKELNKLSIHPEIDNSILGAINVGNDYIDIYTTIAGFRFSKDFKLIEKFIELDTTLANIVRINSVDYLNNKIYIGTHHFGLLVLNDNLEIIEDYTAENSKMNFSKSCGTSYDSTNGSVISKTCGLSLFHIDKNGEQLSSFLNWGNIDEFNIIDNKYYISFTSYDGNNQKGNIVRTNNSFEILDTMKFDNQVDFNDYTRITEIKEIENHICYYLFGSKELVVIENKTSGENNYLKLNDIGIKFLIDFKEIDGNLALCTTNGIFEYDFDTKSIQQVPINNSQANRQDSTFRDLDKFGEKSYLAASGNGVYILDEITNVIEKNNFYQSQYFRLKQNVLNAKVPNLNLKIYNLHGHLINSFNNFTSINLDKLALSTGIYNLIISKNNSVIGLEKFIKVQ